MARPVEIGPANPDLQAEISASCVELIKEYHGKSPGQIAGLQPARKLYRAFGVDPTKTRPSSEALLRRIVKHKPFPLISNAVDVCNLCALKFLLSLGLYDVDKIQGKVVLRKGRPGESFAGIRKGQVNLDGRLVLADDLGAFGNPSSDSLRTSVDEKTTAVWMTIFAPQDFLQQLMQEHVATCTDLFERYLLLPGSSASIEREVVGGSQA
jgi:DNA/RNA-binding domain of Phe-tRNA-synthetase-like protein